MPKKIMMGLVSDIGCSQNGGVISKWYSLERNEIQAEKKILRRTISFHAISGITMSLLRYIDDINELFNVYVWIMIVLCISKEVWGYLCCSNNTQS